MLAKITAVLAAITAFVHFFVGGADALAPTLAADLSAPTSGAMHACWHFVSVFLFLSAFVFIRGGETAFHFSILWILFAIVFIYVGLYQGGPGGLLVNPQWTILLTTGLIGLMHRRNELVGQLRNP
jgi:hypothetical protein